MRELFVMCAKDLRQRLRDRTALLVGIVAPLALTTLMGLALVGSQGLRMRLAIADLDQTAASRALVEHASVASLEGIVFVRPADSVDDIERALEADEAETGLVIEAGFAESLAAGEIPALLVLRRGEESFAARMTDALVRDFLHRRGGAAPSVVQLSPGGQLRVIDFFAASMAVLFLTFSVLAGVRALQSEIDDGTVARLLASPAAPVAIFAGKLGALFLIGLVQMSVMIAATQLLFSTYWGEPLPAAALVGTSVLMAVGLTSFFVSLAGDAERGQGLASISIFLLAVIGGQFLPPQGLPDVFETLNRLTPNGQAFRGFTDLAAAGTSGSLRTILEPLLVTGGVGVAGLGFSAWRARAALEKVA